MHVRNYCNICVCKMLFQSDIHLSTRKCGLKNSYHGCNRLYLNNSKVIFLNISEKLKCFKFSMFPLHTCQILGAKHNDDKTKKPTSDEKGDKKDPQKHTDEAKSTTNVKDDKDPIINDNATIKKQSDEEKFKKSTSVEGDKDEPQSNKAVLKNLDDEKEKSKESALKLDDNKKQPHNIETTPQKLANEEKINPASDTEKKQPQNQHKATTPQSLREEDKYKSFAPQGGIKRQTLHSKMAAGKQRISFLKPPNHPRSLRNKRIRQIALILLGIAGVYYYMHLVYDPILERYRFHLFSDTQTKIIGKIQSDHYKKKYKNKLVTSGKVYDKLVKTLNILIKSNLDLPWTSGGRDCSVFMIDDPDFVNSVVLATGDVFVYSGLVEAVENDDDRIAALLAHQVAHVLLSHHAEIPSWKGIFLPVLLHSTVNLYQILPAAFLQSLVFPVMKGLSITVANHSMGQIKEEEADKLSIRILSKACYDPRKAKEFWLMVETLRKTRKVHLLKAHPSHKSRAHLFDSLMPSAFNILHKNCHGNQHPFFR